MNAKVFFDFIVKTASNVSVLNYVQKESLNNLGKYLGRLVSKVPAASTPFFAGIAISLISDAAEKGIAMAFKGTRLIKAKGVVQIVVRLGIGAGVFALTAGTGGLVPAMIAGAKFAAILYVADKVARMAIVVIRLIISEGLKKISECTKNVSPKFSSAFQFVQEACAPYEIHLFY